MPVSPVTEAKLRAAMQRLLNGTPQHTDGAFTKENLAREAGVSHATVHRADTILAEWNTRVDQPPARTTPGVPGDEADAGLRSALRDANQKITVLNGRLDALATVTANLYRENQALRAALDHRTQLAPLPANDQPRTDGHGPAAISRPPSRDNPPALPAAPAAIMRRPHQWHARSARGRHPAPRRVLLPAARRPGCHRHPGC
jgi:hypothetical protein